ncbi:hypothetical protein HU200_052565 [Digitaria exilis]|uniref:Uncharacterized protein n=1 Tax=Digitaria exilis TaxID=1010633 RepID=A0A835ANP0_9POAL|nr:hypothetical protein HU200_052565 [Digitaria exilis]
MECFTRWACAAFGRGLGLVCRRGEAPPASTPYGPHHKARRCRPPARTCVAVASSLITTLAAAMSALAGVRDRLRGKIGFTKIRSYRRWTLPRWATDLDDNSDDYERTPSVSTSEDRRLGKAQEELRSDPRCAHCQRQGDVVSTAKQKEGDPRQAAATEDANAQEERSCQIRQRWLLRERKEEELLPKEDEELATVESESDSESEQEAASEQENMRIPVVKVLKEVVRGRMELPKLETRQIVVDAIIKEEQTKKTRDEETYADIDTTIPAETRRGRFRKKTRKFIQRYRYYHKGAFFQEKADDGSQMSGMDDI